MKPTLNHLIVALAFLAFFSCAAPADPSGHEAHAKHTEFTGVPRDIDYIKTWNATQVILQGTPPTDQLIARAMNDHIQGILLVALSLKQAVSVDYVADDSNRLTAVQLKINALAEEGFVTELSADEHENSCRAGIIDDSKLVEVWTKSAHMRAILGTAVRLRLPVQEFAYDAKTKEITRGKVNVDLKK